MLWNMKDEFELGYVLGLIVGEGSFSGDKKPRVSVKQKENLDVLQSCVKVFGGRINGPYEYERKGGGKPYRYHAWSLDGPDLLAALPLMKERMPLSVKRDQMFDWVKKYGL